MKKPTPLPLFPLFGLGLIPFYCTTKPSCCQGISLLFSAFSLDKPFKMGYNGICCKKPSRRSMEMKIYE